MHPFDFSQYYFNSYSILLFICGALIGLLGWKVVASRRSKANLYFGAICFSTIVWLIFTAIGCMVPNNERLALFWFKFDLAGVSLISINVYAFVVSFLEKERARLIKIGYGLGSFFCILTLTTNPMIIGLKKFHWGFFVQRDIYWSSFFLLYFFIYMVAAFSELITAYRQTSDPVRRNLIKYIISAFGIAYLGSVDFLPTYGFNIYPWGFAAITAFVAITAYAILRHHLMDINVVIRKTLIYSVVSAGLAAVYAGTVTLLARFAGDYPKMPNLSLPFSISPFALSGVLAGISSAIFGVFVLFKTQNKKLGTLWLLFSFSVAAYGFGCFFVGTNALPGLLGWRLMYGFGVVWIPILFFHFICSFLEIQRPRTIQLQYIIGVAFFCLLPTQLFFDHVQWDFNSFYYAMGGPMYLPFFLWWMSLVVYSHYVMIRAYQAVSSEKCSQIKWFLFATAVGFTGGSLSYLPSFGINIYPWGNFTVWLYPVIMSYAILEHHLMDITVVVKKTLLYSLISAALASVYVGTITLVAQVLGSRNGAASAFSSALAAVFITLLFNPLRIHTQRWIDHHFPREHLDPELLQEAAGTFAHEMKRPLTKISLPAQLLLMEVDRVESGETNWKEFLPILKQRLQFIINQSTDAGYVIEAIRELSSSSVPFEAVGLPLAVAGALATNKDLLDKHEVTVRLRLSENLPSVSGRPKQLEIVFVNLIKNAVEAMRNLAPDMKRELRIEGRSDHAHVIISLTDTGPGVKPEDVGKLFSARYSTKGQGGTGLGLYLSRQIIQGHNGAVEVSSQPGRGTTFTIRLPVHT